ncbi:MAG: 50S ribosomal protein L1 [Bdellovibrionota bacterium]
MAGKKYVDFAKKVEAGKVYPLKDAVALIKDSAGLTKFDASIDIAVRLNIDPRHADQQVRGTVLLPAGTGKKIRIAVFAKAEKAREAQDAGADIVGAEDLVKRVQEENFLDFDAVIATPDLMGQVGRIGKVLGPRGLMPNPKLGTVTMDVGKAVKELKAGRSEFKAEKAGIVQLSLGRASFSADQIETNVRAFLETLIKARPAGAKGTFIKSITLSTTMGPGIRLNPAEVETATGAEAA